MSSLSWQHELLTVTSSGPDDGEEHRSSRSGSTTGYTCPIDVDIVIDGCDSGISFSY